MARITWNKDKDDTLDLFRNGGIVLTGRNINPAWLKKVREQKRAQEVEGKSEKESRCADGEGTGP